MSVIKLLISVWQIRQYFDTWLYNFLHLQLLFFPQDIQHASYCSKTECPNMKCKPVSFNNHVTVAFNCSSTFGSLFSYRCMFLFVVLTATLLYNLSNRWRQISCTWKLTKDGTKIALSVWIHTTLSNSMQNFAAEMDVVYQSVTTPGNNTFLEVLIYYNSFLPII